MLIARLQQAGRVAWAILSTAACALLLAGFVRSDVSPLVLDLLIIIVVAVMAWRPSAGAAAIVLFVPAAFPLLALTEASIRPEALTEALIVAALGGAGARAILSSRERPASRLAGPAWILGVLIAASAIVQLVRGNLSAPAAIVRDVLAHAGGDYFFATNLFRTLHDAMYWIEGLALAVVIERALRGDPASTARALWMFLVGGAAAASFAWQRIADVVLRRDNHWDALLFMLRSVRISTLFPDFNAAGSYFTLLFTPAIWIGVARRWWGTLLVIAPVTLLALLVTQSRAAIGAVAIVLAGAWTVRALRRGQFVRVAVLGIVLAAAAYGGAHWTSGTHGTADAALAIRSDMAQVAIKMWRDDPIFGAGVGTFRAASRAYLPADLIRLFPVAAGGENAHNQFLQVLAEFGLPGLLAFLALSLGAAWRALFRPASPEHAALGAGLAAFLISCVFGHPLLIPQVLALFFVAIGLCAGLAAAPSPPSTLRRAVTGAAIAMVVVTLPFRITNEFRPAAPAIVGAGEVEGALDGVDFRRASSTSAWLFSPYARSFELPMRWADAAASNCTVEITLDGQLADVVRLSGGEWRTVRYPVPQIDNRTYERKLELKVEPPSCALLVGPLALTR